MLLRNVLVGLSFIVFVSGVAVVALTDAFYLGIVLILSTIVFDIGVLFVTRRNSASRQQ